MLSAVTATANFPAISPIFRSIPFFPAKPYSFQPLHHRHYHFIQTSSHSPAIRREFKTPNANRSPQQIVDGDEDHPGVGRMRFIRVGLWVLEGVYILWLFLLPYAPFSFNFSDFNGDPVWAISSETVSSLVGLSLNFFFILPLANAAGIHIIEAPVLHPMSEGLFNLVIGWTLMFAPLLYTDCKRDRYKGSLDVLWGLQMFLTNTLLIPYMAIRLNQADEENNWRKPSKLGTVMIKGASAVGFVGVSVCITSILWALFGRMDGDFGGLTDRWNFLLSYLGSERLAYAFVWDIVLYSIFQPWLIGENLENVEESRVETVNFLRYIPVVGLVSYLLFLKREEELQ